MINLTGKRFTTILCYFLALNLSLAPVVNASVGMFGGSSNEVVDVDRKCVQHSSDLMNDSNSQHQIAMKGMQDMDCEHGTSCKILCSVSFSALQSGSAEVLGVSYFSQWLLIDISSFESLYLSRLKRPPRL